MRFRLLGELPLAACTTLVSIGHERQSQVISGFIIAVYPGESLGKMLRRGLVLFEDDFQPSGGLFQSNTVRKTSESALVSGERSRQFSVTFLVSAESQKVIGATIRF